MSTPPTLQEAIAWARRWQAEYELAPADTVRAVMAAHYRVLADAAEEAQRLKAVAARLLDANSPAEVIMIATDIMMLLPNSRETAMATSAGPAPPSLSPWPEDLGTSARRLLNGRVYASLEWWDPFGFVVWSATRRNGMSSITGSASSPGDAAGAMGFARKACDDALVQLGWPSEEVSP